jgi:hypothetical protein
MLCFNSTGKLKAHELRTKGKSELLGQLADLKSELSTVLALKILSSYVSASSFFLR